MPLSSGSGSSGSNAWPEDLTPRALFAGVIVGSLLAFTNLYFGLQSSWITMGSLQAALVGYGLVKVLPPLPRGMPWLRTQAPFSPQENAVLQAVAVSLGSMPLTTGLIGIIPAFSLLDPKRDGEGALPMRLGTAKLILWCASMAFFGVFFASPLRVIFILKEKLVFPSGTATAQLIAVIHKVPLRDFSGETSALSEDTEAGGCNRHRTRSDLSRRNTGSEEEERMLLWDEEHEELHREEPQEAALQPSSLEPSDEQSEIENSGGALSRALAASAGLTLLAHFFPVIYALPIFDLLSPHHNLASRWGWWFTPSLSYVGQGVIMGLPTTASMCAGAVVGWGILSPLATYKGWSNPESPMDPDHGARAFILWICLAVMTSESLVGFLPLILTGQSTNGPSVKHCRTLGASGDAPQRGNTREVSEVEPANRLVPTSWVVVGLMLSTISAVALLCSLFAANRVGPFTVLIGIFFSFFFALLSCKSLGQVDLNPVGAIGKLTQALFAVVAPGNIVANLVGGALSEAGELQQDFKTGHLIGASPRGQFGGQLVGSTFGIVVSVLAYKLYERSYELPGPEMPAPAARLWLNFARLVSNGELPNGAAPLMLIFAIIFGVTGTLKAMARVKSMRGLRAESEIQLWERVADYMPSGIAFAVGLGLNTPNYSIARLCGGVLAAAYERRYPKAPSSASGLPPVYLLILSAGFVLGEGAASIVALFLKEAGLGPLSCFGCRGGCGGGC